MRASAITRLLRGHATSHCTPPSPQLADHLWIAVHFYAYTVHQKTHPSSRAAALYSRRTTYKVRGQIRIVYYNIEQYYIFFFQSCRQYNVLTYIHRGVSRFAVHKCTTIVLDLFRIATQFSLENSFGTHMISFFKK